MLRPELLEQCFLVAQDFFADFRHAFEEPFLAARRLKEDEQLSFAVPDHRKRMRDPPRRKGRVSGAQYDGLVADACHEPAAHHTEPFILEEMTVKSRSALGVADCVIDANSTN